MGLEYIYDAALILLRNQGIRATRMEDLAAYLQISKRTLYGQFPNKDVFLLACIRYEIKKEREIISRLEKKVISPLKQIVKLYSHAIRFFRSFHPSFFKDLRRYAESGKEMNRYILFLRKEFNDLLYKSILSGLCVEDCDTFLVSGFLILRLEEIKDGMIDRPEKIKGVSSFVVSSILLGYSTEEGKKQLNAG